MKPTQIIIHCSDTPTGRNTPASEIHQWHLDRNWSGIGYHWIIGIDGSIDAGRPEYWKGSHCKGQNNDSISICLIGRGDYSKIQMNNLKMIIFQICKRHGIPRKNIKGHYEYDSKKTCPMFDVAEWVSNNF